MLYRFRSNPSETIPQDAINNANSKSKAKSKQAEEQSSGLQIVNPPYVHSLSVNGRRVAAALGDFRVVVYDLNNNQLQHSLHGHSSSVSQVQFATFGSEYLISGGNDSLLILWDLSRTPTSQPPSDEPFDSNELREKINHGSKVNWLVTTRAGNIYVADQSTTITCYQFI
eukprot:TRINITY_DN3688_c0_g1_i2.p1 TRINITY_DN3688_c0_g1~~TRINITY_DN3688_c0_g1_i2.p1  ORF type:complete len:170 (-),score=32.83 TRINITY_DN3688_c0_g1_i2:67-576(-)